MEIKAVVFDLDRTLLRSDETISQETVDTLERAHRQGVKMVICTGRTQTAAAYAIERLGNVSYVISHAGCVITDGKTGEVVYRVSLPRELAVEIAEITDRYDNTFVEGMSSGTSIVSEASLELAESAIFSQKYIDLIKRDIIIPENLTEFVRKNDIVELDKFFMFTDTQEKADALYAELCAKDAYTVLLPMPLGVEVLSKGIDKGTGVKELAKLLGIGLENIMVAGDSDNDYSMFLPEVFKVAVGNAIDSIRDAADYIAPTNDEDGVAYAVKKFVLKEEV